MRKYGKSILLGYLTLLAFSIEMAKKTDSGSLIEVFLRAFSANSLERWVLLAGLVLLYYCMFRIIDRKRDRAGRDIRYAALLGILAAMAMLVGQTVDYAGSVYGLFSDSLQILKSCTKFAGYVPLFTMIALSLFYVGADCDLTGSRNADGTLSGTAKFFEKHAFWRSFLLICLCYIPYLVLSYPAILQGDSQSMIPEAFGLPGTQSKRLILLDKNVTLNGHHPLAYTLLLHGGLLFGKTLFHSYNAGLFAVALLQFLYAALVISYLIYSMVQMRIDHKLCAAVLLYYVLSPRIVSYMALISKDVIYSYSVLLLVIQIAKCLYLEYSSATNVRGGTQAASVILLCLVVAFLRNEGRYIIFFWMLLLIFRFRKARKWMSTALFVTMAAVILVNNILMPYYKITPGSIREIMSIPFQQTARYVSVSPEDVTEEERAAIDKLLGYDTLENRYDPDSSDLVKDEYNENVDREDWIRYFHAWFEMLKRHPFIYLDATICNYYYYFYPGGRIAKNYSYEWAEYCMHVVNSMTESVGMDLHFPQELDGLRTAYEGLREGLLHLPIVGVLGCTAAYVWILLFFAVFLLWGKKIDVLFVSVVPLLGSLGISLLGPCNGDYFRYAYIFTIVLPVVAVLSLHKGSHT